MKELLYATNNPGKQKEVGKFLAQHNIKTLSPADLGIDINPEESGSTLEENAKLKWKAYSEATNNPELIIMSDDTGVEIDALDGEPGIHVRRWKGHRMTDQEIIDYCMELMEEVPESDRGAQMRTVLAVGLRNNEPNLFSGIARGSIVKEPVPMRMKGFPFESVFFLDEYGKMLGDIHNMSTVEKEELGFHSHRERAVINALSYIKDLLTN